MVASSAIVVSGEGKEHQEDRHDRCLFVRHVATSIRFLFIACSACEDKKAFEALYSSSLSNTRNPFWWAMGGER